MPQVLEKRNLFWDSDTEYSLNGEALHYRETFNSFPKQVTLAQSNANKGTLLFQVGELIVQAVPRQQEQEKPPTAER